MPCHGKKNQQAKASVCGKLFVMGVFDGARVFLALDSGYRTFPPDFFLCSFECNALLGERGSESKIFVVHHGGFECASAA